MSQRATLYVTTREAWREWLAAHYRSAPEIWLIYSRQGSGAPRIPYNDAVEEALCFGWIDSITWGIDEARYAQRFSPRKRRSGYSQTNKERLRRLLVQGKVQPELRAELEAVIAEPFIIPPDIAAALRADPAVWANFQRYSEAYRRIRVAYVETARGRGEEFGKRLMHLLDMTRQNRQFGFGIEAYY